MIEKDLANLTCEFMNFLTSVFFKSIIDLETYILSAKSKIDFLEAFIKGNKDIGQNLKILKIIIQYKIILHNKKPNLIAI